MLLIESIGNSFSKLTGECTIRVHQGKTELCQEDDQKTITRKCTNRINNYINKAACIVINYCLDNDIGILVMSYNKTFQKDSNIGKNYNQSYVDIPYEMLQDKLEYLCKSNGIILAIQEESNTS